MSPEIQKLIDKIDNMEPLQAGFSPSFLVTEPPVTKDTFSRSIEKFLKDMGATHVNQ